MQSFFSAKKLDPAPADGGAVLSPPPAIRYSPALNCRAAAAGLTGLSPVIGQYMISNLYHVAALCSQQYDCEPGLQHAVPNLILACLCFAVSIGTRQTQQGCVNGCV